MNVMIAVMSGQGCGGLLASIINLITLASMDSSHSAAFVFFSLAAMFSIIMFYLYYNVLKKSELFCRHTSEIATIEHNSHKLVNLDDQNENTHLQSANIDIFGLIKTHLWPYMLR